MRAASFPSLAGLFGTPTSTLRRILALEERVARRSPVPPTPQPPRPEPSAARREAITLDEEVGELAWGPPEPAPSQR